MVLQQAHASVQQGQAQLAAKNYARAEKLFLAALATWPGDEEALLCLARTYLQQGKKDRAAEVFRGLIYKKDPGTIASSPTTLLKFVLLLTEMRQWEEAVAVYERAMASSELNLQRLPRIIVHFRPDVWDVKKMQTMSHMVLAICSLGHHPPSSDEDIAHLRLAVKLQPTFALAHLYLGFGLEWADRANEPQAEISYKRAAELAEKEPEVRAKALRFLDEMHYYQAVDAHWAKVESKR